MLCLAVPALQRRQRKEAEATLKAQQREQAARAFKVASERKTAVLAVVRRVSVCLRMWEMGTWVYLHTVV